MSFQSFSQHFTFFLPFWHFLLFWLLILWLNFFIFQCYFFSLLINDIHFERFTFGLKNFLADFDVFLKSLWLEFAATSFRTFLKYDIFLFLSKLGHLLIRFLNLIAWLNCSFLQLLYGWCSKIFILILCSSMIYGPGIDLSIFEGLLFRVFCKMKFVVSWFDWSVLIGSWIEIGSLFVYRELSFSRVVFFNRILESLVIFFLLRFVCPGLIILIFGILF